MTERGLVTAAITIIGLWRILNGGMNSLYYVVVKQMGLKTTSMLPVATDIQAVIWNVLVGVVVILAAPAIASMIFGKARPQT